MRALILAALPPCKCTNNGLCIYLFSLRDSRADLCFDTPPIPHLLMKGLHSIFLHFPLDTAITSDRWDVLALKKVIPNTLSLEIGFKHPPLLLLFFASSFLPLFLSLSLSDFTEGHAVNVPFRAALYKPSCQVNPLLPWVRQLAR